MIEKFKYLNYVNYLSWLERIKLNSKILTPDNQTKQSSYLEVQLFKSNETMSARHK